MGWTRRANLQVVANFAVAMYRCNRQPRNVEYRTVPKGGAPRAVWRPTAKFCLELTSRPEGVREADHGNCEQKHHDQQRDYPPPT